VDIVAETTRAYEAFAAGRHAEAAHGAQRVLKEAPGEPGALTLIARLALAAGEPAVSHDVLAGLLKRFPEKGALWLDLAQTLRDLGRYPEAAEAALRAVELEPRNELAWIRLGEIRLFVNQGEIAAEAFRRALQLNRDSVAALRGLAQVTTIDPDSETPERMHQLLSTGSLAPKDVAGLHYSLARIYRTAGRREPFIRHLFAANAMQRSVSAVGLGDYRERFERLEAAFTQEAFAAASYAEPVTPTPIFILGMPRSGTTLLEQLLAGHPRVHAGGELEYMSRSLRRAIEQRTGQPYPLGFETIPASEMTAMARAYADRLRLVGHGAPIVTDKTPGNYHVLGLLRLLFPAGKIVHLSRDPMDNCFSILQQQFDERSPHTCDVSLLAHLYARYQQQMVRWQQLFGGEFITVHYEQLVGSPSTEGRRVFEHCDLEWSDDYLDFHRHDRPVRTFSAQQVRQPIHRGSVGAWREFAVELEPLRRALDSEMLRLGLTNRSPAS
jgi:Sulfotransferase family/Tetratricopeptide repeat